MATAQYTTSSAPTLQSAVIAYLQRTNDAPITPIFVEAVCAELAHLIDLTGDDELEDRDFRYAIAVASDEPVDFDDVPPALWPNW